ncbi:GNAT family N-acetyltransferase [Vibrio sagamiensis]|uniref:GCN5 family acetyltransferase n=1 Tax=Vibrio sagamiensis NBRC 104589 TaxID=1219064 RepID=A0A511QCK1_9VIBR|nr:GNAT family N-acetyltransferase [Vibrio sagamiensis]PNQ54196.1 N-acetyltransferase [Vibrio agarivorans]GEM75025.1 GCN5 family acetyltransferase [Vibrio sagamiensis NBRC 104589]
MEIKEYSDDLLVAVSELYLNTRIFTFTWIDTHDYQLSDFRRDTEGERVLVAVAGGEVLGFISIWEPENFIHHLYISNKHQGKSIGTQLLEKAKYLYRSLTLKCIIENERAIGFYESKGFIRAQKGTVSLGDYYIMEFNSHT